MYIRDRFARSLAVEVVDQDHLVGEVCWHVLAPRSPVRWESLSKILKYLTDKVDAVVNVDEIESCSKICHELFTTNDNSDSHVRSGRSA